MSSKKEEQQCRLYMQKVSTMNIYKTCVGQSGSSPCLWPLARLSTTPEAVVIDEFAKQLLYFRKAQLKLWSIQTQVLVVTYEDITFEVSQIKDTRGTSVAPPCQSRCPDGIISTPFWGVME